MSRKRSSVYIGAGALSSDPTLLRTNQVSLAAEFSMAMESIGQGQMRTFSHRFLCRHRELVGTFLMARVALIALINEFLNIKGDAAVSSRQVRNHRKKWIFTLSLGYF